jgi:hypothetical protein
MPVDIRRHLNRGVTEPRLHHLERHFEPAVGAAVDAPGGVKVAQGVEPAVLGAPLSVNHAGCDLSWMKRPPDDVLESVRSTSLIGEREIEVAPGTGELPFTQHIHEQGWQRNGALPRNRFRATDLLVTIGALANVEDCLFEVDISPAQPT